MIVNLIHYEIFGGFLYNKTNEMH